MLGSRTSVRWKTVRLRPTRPFSTSTTRYSSSSSSISSTEETRRATAFKQHPDIAHIRENVALHEANTVLRNYGQHKDIPSRVSARASRISEINIALRQPRVQIKALQSRLTATKDFTDKSRIVAEIKKLKPLVDKLVAEQDALEDSNRSDALLLPNLTSPLTPIGDEAKLLTYINYDPLNPPKFDQSADHSTIAEDLGLVDFSSASMASGWGFYYLLGEAALLEQALIQYALAVARRYPSNNSGDGDGDGGNDKGWEVATPPSLVYSHVAEACGFQPRDSDDLQQIWQIAQPPRLQGKPKRSLAATAEIPLAALYAGKDIPAHALPVKLIGSSRCYRAEAGARGVDTKGLYRVHEFTKVEMFAWTDQASGSGSESESANTNTNTTFDEMVDIQKHILRSLGLPCRVLEMPTADLGASAYRKIDIEALFPSRGPRSHGTEGSNDPKDESRSGDWGEVTSASICTDYQTRRLDTRILDPSGSRKKFPHTINGTALAVPRVLAAILEHGWQPRDRCVVIPEPLRPYMDGLEVIQPQKRRRIR